MLTYIIRRILLIVPTLIGITAIVFFVMALSPGGVGGFALDDVDQLDTEAGRQQAEYYRERYGLDDPLIVQYGRWLNLISPIGLQAADDADALPRAGVRWATGLEDEPHRYFGLKRPDLGESLHHQEPVVQRIRAALPITVLLSVITIPIIYSIGILTGLFAARFQGQAFDVGSGTFFLALWAVPVIWAAVLLVGFFANREIFYWFPTAGLHSIDADRMLFLPTAAALGQTAGFIAYVLMWVVGAAAVALLPLGALWLAVRFARYLWRPGRGLPAWRAPVICMAGGGLGLLVAAVTIVSNVLPSEMPGPERGWLLDMIWHLVLPVICLSYAGFAFLSKLTRGSILENLRSDFVRTARAKGVGEREVLFRHVFRNSLLPLITVAVSILPGLLAGSVVVERIFSIPGMGREAVDAVLNRDREMILAITLISGLIGLTAQLIRDICYAIADPRVSYD